LTRPRFQAVIRGSGIVSSLGRGKDANTAAMRDLRTGLRASRDARPFLQAKTPLNDVPDAYFTPSDLNGSWHRNDAMARIALKEALDEAGWERGIPDVRSCALMVGCCIGDSWEAEMWCRHRNPDPTAALEASEPGPGRVGLRLARWLGTEGVMMTLPTACTSSANALVAALQMLALKRADRVIVVGVHTMTRTEVCGFESMMLLDPDGCHPFDLRRNGIQLGEGAAAVILERTESRGNDTPRITGWASTCDPYHLTTSAPDGEGAAAAMGEALKKAGISPERVSGVKAHGTGTPNNDLAEGRAIRRLFGEKAPPITSLKRYFGHTMGASGLLEMVALLSCVRQGFFPASLGTNTFDPETKVSPTRAHRPVRSGPFLLSSFGFGGSCVSLVVKG
jgi:3-oxoacyl-(acyl-carrier-protein) synthase